MPRLFENFVIVADQSGSQIASNDVMNFVYLSSSYGDILTSGSLAKIQVNTLEATDEGARGELLFIISDNEVTSSGKPVMRLFHTGSSKEPRVGIGFDVGEEINKTFEIQSKEDSSTGTEIILKSGRPDLGAEIGDLAGSLTFIIDSGSFEDAFITGAIAQIDTVVINTGSGDNMSGNLRIYSSPEWIEILEPVAEFGFRHKDGVSNDSSAIAYISGSLIVGGENQSQADLKGLQIHCRTDSGDSDPTLQLELDGTDLTLLSGSLDINTDITSSKAKITGLTTSTETDYVVVDSSGNLSKRTGGADGTSGSSGSSGTSGSSGSSGTSGSSGSSGTSGSSGSSGTSGSSGSSGTSASVGGSNTQVQYNNNGVLGGDSDLTWNSSTNTLSVLSASIDRALINDTLQGNGSGFQFFSFNEDTTKLKFVNWYTDNDNQYGMGMLWYETWFGAIDTDGDANDINRRIGFYLEEPNSGSTDSPSGVTGVHPSNARFYVDVTGSYVASGSLTVTDANFKVSSSGAVTSQGYAVVSQSSAFTDNEFVIADGTGGVTSTDALAVDSSGNLGIGTNAPAVRLHMVGEGQGTSQFRMDQYNDTQDAPDFRTKRARGTEASPSDVNAGDYLFRINVEGRDSNAFTTYASMQFDVDDSDQDACVWNIQTRNTAGTVADRLTIDKDGDATFAGDLAINGISNVSESIAAAGSGGGAVATYTNGVNNRIITSTGTDGINGESTLTYNGTILNLNGTLNFPPGTANNGISTRVDNQWESTTLENNGEYIQVGTAITRTQHALYNLGSSGWVDANADDTTTSTGFLGIAVDGNSGNDFLIKGIYNTNTVDGTSPAIGDPVYVSTTDGRVTVDAPTATGDVVRCCGHIIDTFVSGRTTYYKIYFNPSPDFIEN